MVVVGLGQNIMVIEVCGGGLGEPWGPDVTSKESPVTPFLQLGPSVSTSFPKECHPLWTKSSTWEPMVGAGHD